MLAVTMRAPSTRRKRSLLRALLATAIVGCGGSEPATETPPPAPHRDRVIVIHGFGPSRAICAPLAEALEDEGFSVELLEYPSSTASFERGGEILAASLDRLAADPTVRVVHLVTHSMGGIVARSALRERIPEKLGRIVMIAPPNRGSPKANLFAPAFSWWLDPLAELTTHEESAVNRLPPVSNLTVGVIAGANDWTVPPEYTAVEGATDSITYEKGLGATHNGLVLGNAEVRRQIVHFLDHGVFDHAPRPEDGSDAESAMQGNGAAR